MKEDSLPEWDTSELVMNMELEGIKQELSDITKEAIEFRSKYLGEIKDFDASSLNDMLSERDKIRNKIWNFYGHCWMNFRVHTDDSETRKLYDYSEKSWLDYEKAVAFLEPEVARLLRENPFILEHRAVDSYRFYLTKLYERAQHMLPEDEEHIIAEQKRFGPRAWSNLQSEIIGSAHREIKIDGKSQSKSLFQLRSLFMNSTEPELRRKAEEAFYAIAEENKRVLAYAFRSICGSYVTEMERRGWEDCVAPVLHEEGLTKGTIDSMHKTIDSSSSILSRYLKTKASLLSLEKLRSCDQWAPATKHETDYAWTEACKIVTSAYSRFDEEIGGWMKNLLTSNRISAKPRKGKAGTGSNWSFYNPNLSWITLNFTGASNDLITLAHEAGHAYHSYLSASNNVYIHWSEVPYSMAETASKFGELLLLDYLLQNAEKKTKLAILCNLLDTFRSSYTMLSIFRFETKIYDAVSSGVYLDPDTIAKLVVDSRLKPISDSIEWNPKSRWGWAIVSHLFRTDKRYYNFPYAFGQLLVYALYDRYRREGESFKPEIINILKAGGSAAPRDILAKAGFDITTKAFWKTGMNYAENLVKELEALVNEG